MIPITRISTLDSPLRSISFAPKGRNAYPSLPFLPREGRSCHSGAISGKWSGRGGESDAGSAQRLRPVSSPTQGRSVSAGCGGGTSRGRSPSPGLGAATSQGRGLSTGGGTGDSQGRCGSISATGPVPAFEGEMRRGEGLERRFGGRPCAGPVELLLRVAGSGRTVMLGRFGPLDALRGGRALTSHPVGVISPGS
jgi:hypothetical protein